MIDGAARASSSPTPSAGSTPSIYAPAPSGPAGRYAFFSDFRRQLDWGALTIADGAVYVPTAAYCDVTSPGGVHRVDLMTRAVTSWLAVSLANGGGGGPWGWGGIAFDGEDGALYVATSGALVGGDNTGDNFTETADYGQRLVRLSTDLAVVASSHPDDLPDRQDLDFVGSPVVVDRPGCGKLIVAATKNAVVYAWRANAVDSGPIWRLKLETYDARNPMLANLAWSSDTASLYAVTGTQLVRAAVGRDCGRTVIWRKALGTNTENGSPTIAGDTVWFAVNWTGPDVRLRRDDGQTDVQRTARRDDARGTHDCERPARRRHDDRPPSGFHVRSGNDASRRNELDQLGRKGPRLAEPCGRRLVDRRRRTILDPDLRATGAPRAATFQEHRPDLGGRRPRIVHVHDPAVLDGHERPHLATLNDPAAALHRRRRPHLHMDEHQARDAHVGITVDLLRTLDLEAADDGPGRDDP